MDRRGFFKHAGKKLLKGGLDLADEQVESAARNWIRPPHALKELDFLLACTRCGACVEACPPGSLFPLPAHVGPKAVSTPALDLQYQSCLLCADWPCVTACEPGALKRDPDQPLHIAKIGINPDFCLPYSGPECGVCLQNCPIPGALLDNLGKPEISDQCCGCGQCRVACISNPKAIEVSSIHAD